MRCYNYKKQERACKGQVTQAKLRKEKDETTTTTTTQKEFKGTLGIGMTNSLLEDIEPNNIIEVTIPTLWDD